MSWFFSDKKICLKSGLRFTLSGVNSFLPDILSSLEEELSFSQHLSKTHLSKSVLYDKVIPSMLLQKTILFWHNLCYYQRKSDFLHSIYCFGIWSIFRNYNGLHECISFLNFFAILWGVSTILMFDLFAEKDSSIRSLFSRNLIPLILCNYINTWSDVITKAILFQLPVFPLNAIYKEHFLSNKPL